MATNIDFMLSKKYGVVEKTIFRLVLSGIADVRTISGLLPVYADEVIANAIKRLVNSQVLRASLETRMLSVSEPVLALIQGCLEHSGNIEFPEELLLDDGKVCISDEDTKRKLLAVLLPSVNVEFLVKQLDFYLYL